MTHKLIWQCIAEMFAENSFAIGASDKKRVVEQAAGKPAHGHACEQLATRKTASVGICQHFVFVPWV